MNEEEIQARIDELTQLINQRSNFLINNDPQVQRMAGQMEILKTLQETDDGSETDDS